MRSFFDLCPSQFGFALSLACYSRNLALPWPFQAPQKQTGFRGSFAQLPHLSVSCQLLALRLKIAFADWPLILSSEIDLSHFAVPINRCGLTQYVAYSSNFPKLRHCNGCYLNNSASDLWFHASIDHLRLFIPLWVPSVAAKRPALRKIHFSELQAPSHTACALLEPTQRSPHELGLFLCSEFRTTSQPWYLRGSLNLLLPT